MYFSFIFLFGGSDGNHKFCDDNIVMKTNIVNNNEKKDDNIVELNKNKQKIILIENENINYNDDIKYLKNEIKLLTNKLKNINN